jgi:hypothetical protein
MARAGAGNASEFSPDGALLPMAFAAIALCIAGDASAHGGRLNAEGCHHDRKHGGYHCHRGGASSSRSDLIPANGFSPAQGVRLCVRCGDQVCLRIVGRRGLPVRRRCNAVSQVMGRIWIEMGMGWGVSRGGGDVAVILKRTLNKTEARPIGVIMQFVAEQFILDIRHRGGENPAPH